MSDVLTDGASGELHHDVAYFRDMYDGHDDPWGFDVRWYERRKYDITVAALPRERYRRAFEPGCANGALSDLLRARCDRLVASELLPDVAARAAERLRAHHHVDVVAAPFPQWWPEGTIDLLVLSEVAYYLSPHGREVAGRRLLEHLDVGGDVVAVHYTGDTNYPMQGSAVATWLDGLDGLHRVTTLNDASFELGVWTRTT
jgi:trans-aconitate methyltransferase